MTSEKLAEGVSASLKAFPEAEISYVMAMEIFPRQVDLQAWADENRFFLTVDHNENKITVRRRIMVKANPRCKYCLGTARAQGFYAGVVHVCSCVTEQLCIIVVDKDYSIQARYEPGQPEFVKE